MTRRTLTLVVETSIHTILLPGTVIVALPAWLLSGEQGLDPAGLQWLGLAPIAAGLALGFWCTRDFIVSGRGTPNPLDPPRFLVSGGPYHVVRNPMYVAVLAILLGEAWLFASARLLGYAAVVWLAFHLFVVLYEEPALRGQFGGDYEEYWRAVPRWIPRFGRPWAVQR